MSGDHLYDPKRVEGAILVAECINPPSWKVAGECIYKDELGFFGVMLGAEGEESRVRVLLDDIPWSYSSDWAVRDSTLWREFLAPYGVIPEKMIERPERTKKATTILVQKKSHTWDMK